MSKVSKATRVCILVVLLFAVAACGGPTSTPVIIEKEVIVEVIKEVVVVKEVIKEVLVEKIVIKEVIREVEVIRIVLATPTPAPKPALEILSWRIEPKFPKGVELVVNVKPGGSPPDLRRSRLTLKIKGKTQVVGPKANHKNATPNRLIFVIDGGNNFIVWTEIYGGTLKVTDEQGNVRAELIEPFTYEDTRFTWETRKSENARVLFYGQEAPVKPEEVLGEVEKLLAEYSVTLERPIRIIFYRNKTEIDRAIPFRSKKHEEGTITLGQAFSDIDAVFVSREDMPIDLCLVRHELMHHIVYILAGKADVPAWLNEGLAEYACSEQLSIPEQFRIGYALENGDFKSLVWLSRVPAGKPHLLSLFYAESHSFILFLVEEHGLGKILELLDVLKEDLRLRDGTVEKVYGKSLGDLEAEWVESLTP